MGISETYEENSRQCYNLTNLYSVELKYPELTSEDVPELPFHIMNVPCNKFLCWRLLCEILQTTLYHLLLATEHPRTHEEVNNLGKTHSSHTRGGKTRSAARRGTENPPCVLVSLAVSVLQK